MIQNNYTFTFTYVIALQISADMILSNQLITQM